MLKRILNFFRQKPLPTGKFKGDVTHIACVVSIDTSVWTHDLRKGQPHITANWWGNMTIVNAEFYSSEGYVSKFIVGKAVDKGNILTLTLRRRFSIFTPVCPPEIIIHKITGELHVNAMLEHPLSGTLNLLITRMCTPQETAEFKASAL